ncbi:hypothetical protein [Cecembia lonarensis]|uniref:Uncharacterized protein n=1 Tax=Cecembia lonarensis (strain CCUG 58316 / KCTC 22772 / LW9) TaxID=1225176 RepID=K1LBU6_CECL9|nr:hypothetical protein [Cecembia lonarensis]EKB47783.1 hypothetical protein B879_03616 [Cecembia lonarensis LW9]
MREIKNFRATVLKALHHGTISKYEAKECLIRGIGKQELPIFFDFEPMESSLKNYVTGLEKMGLIEPLIRLEDE